MIRFIAFVLGSFIITAIAPMPFSLAGAGIWALAVAATVDSGFGSFVLRVLVYGSTFVLFIL